MKNNLLRFPRPVKSPRALSAATDVDFPHPTDVYIAQRQREYATLKARQQTAHQVGRLAVAVERLVELAERKRLRRDGA